jgi:hypothetical protein
MQQGPRLPDTKIFDGLKRAAAGQGSAPVRWSVRIGARQVVGTRVAPVRSTVRRGMLPADDGERSDPLAMADAMQ